MESGISSLFRAGALGGESLAVELVSSHARISGSVNLGAYTRLTDLLNFHDEILSVKDGVVLDGSGGRSEDAAPQLDVRLSALTIVLDRSEYVPPPDSEAIEKRAHQMLAVTRGHVITGTFFIYPDAEPISYLRAHEPPWMPVTDVRMRSLVNPRITLSARFAVLNRRALTATAVP